MKPFLHLKKRLLKPRILSLILLLQGAFIQAQTSQILHLSTTIDSFISLSDYTFLLADSNRTLSCESATQVFKNKIFLPYNDFIWEGKYERGRYAYWLAIEMETDSLFPTQDVIFYWNNYDSLDCYLFEDNLLKSEYKCGLFREKNEEQISLLTTKMDFCFKLEPERHYYLLLRFAAATYGLGVGNEPKFFNPSSRVKNLMKPIFPYLLSYGLFLGVLLFTTLFIILQYLLHRDISYLWYAIYLLVTFLYYLRKFGFNIFYDIVPIQMLSWWYMNLGMLMYIFYIIFITAFLSLKKDAPPFFRFNKRVIIGLVIFYIILIIIRYFDPFYAWKLIYYFQMIIGIPAIYFSYRLFQVKNKLAIYVILGSIVLISGNLIGTLMAQMHIIPTGLRNISNLPLQIGILLEVLLFSMGLGYKTRLLAEEKLVIQADLEQNRQAISHQKEMSKLKNTFFTNITHELRTPLTVIISLAEDLRNKLTDSSRHKIDLVQQNGHKLLDMINQLLSLSKLEAGKMELNKKQGDIIPLLHYQCNAFQALANNQHKSFLFHSGEERLIMDFDPDKIQVILTNLLSNAIKFTDEYDKIVLKVKLIVSPTKQLLLEVKDNGRGIAEKNHKRIFDRFYQGEHSENKQGQGTGIGLALVKELVELMEGTIEVKSELGKGSSFSVYLPITQNATTLLLDNQNKKEDTVIDFSIPLESSLDKNDKPFILIVEDNRDVRYILQLCLQNEYHLAQAEDGKKALELIKTKQPDLIISDIMMPIMDGFELCRHIKDNPDTDNIPIVLLTAKATQEDKNKGLACGVDAYLEKPFNKKELLIRVKQLILQRQKQEERYRLWTNKEDDSNEKEENPFLKELNEILEQNYANENIGIVDICHLLGVSRSKFYTKLNDISGLTVGQFIKNFRLQKARGLLLNSPELNIQEITFQIGFSSHSYFSQEFRKAHNCSPMDYRKNYN